MPLTSYELRRLATMAIMPALYGEVRALIREFVPDGASVLDVGGRKSWYTIGLPITVTISDIPRSDEIQHDLQLGMTPAITTALQDQRSNVTGVVIDDMAATALPPASYDAIVSVEVIEHVDDDAAFVANLYQTLKPGGVAILTTPNGDHDPIPRGDHRRHYRRKQLEDLLARSFDDVRVGYAVAATPARMRGLASLDPRQPGRTVKAILGNVTNRMESGRPAVPFSASDTGNLLAVAFRREEG